MIMPQKCNECLKGIKEQHQKDLDFEREQCKQSFIKLIDEIEVKLEKEKGWKYLDCLEEIKQKVEKLK